MPQALAKCYVIIYPFYSISKFLYSPGRNVQYSYVFEESIFPHINDSDVSYSHLNVPYIKSFVFLLQRKHTILYVCMILYDTKRIKPLVPFGKIISSFALPFLTEK